MKKIKLLVATAALTFSFDAFAEPCNYECRRNKVLSDPELSEGIKTELKSFYDEKEKIYQECQKKRKNLTSSLSGDAKKAIAKHRTKREPKNEKK